MTLLVCPGLCMRVLSALRAWLTMRVVSCVPLDWVKRVVWSGGMTFWVHPVEHHDVWKRRAVTLQAEETMFKETG